jgi:hypothetical protein
MSLKLATTGEATATLRNSDGDDAVVIQGDNAVALALKIVRAVNRDKHFDALVAALSPFRSTEMGGLLIDAIDTREHGAEQAQRRLTKLVSMIDVILDAAEAETDDARAGG